MEAELYKRPEFIKHVPVPERPDRIASLERSGLKYYENDYKNYEGSLLPELQEVVEAELVRYLLKGHPDAARLIIETDLGKAFLRFKSVGLVYEMTGERQSGDLWTSLFNGFHNLMMVKFIAHEKGGEVDGFVEGDDGLFACTVDLTEEDFKKMGHKVEIHQLLSPLDGHFCGLTMAADRTLLKDPRRVLRTFGWTESSKSAGHRVMDELLRSKALSLSYEMPQCPVVGALAREALRLTEGLDPRSPQYATWNTIPEGFSGPTTPYHPSDIARSDFARKFGISPEAQILAEKAIRAHDMVSLAELIPPTAWDLTYSSKYLEYG